MEDTKFPHWTMREVLVRGASKGSKDVLKPMTLLTYIKN